MYVCMYVAGRVLLYAADFVVLACCMYVCMTNHSRSISKTPLSLFHSKLFPETSVRIGNLTR